MQKLSDHQKRSLNQMLILINTFLKEEKNFSELVKNLEDLFNIAEYNNEDFKKAWYAYWIPLEIRNADAPSDGRKVKKDEALKELEELRAFLLKEIKKG